MSTTALTLAGLLPAWAHVERMGHNRVSGHVQLLDGLTCLVTIPAAPAGEDDLWHLDELPEERQLVVLGGPSFYGMRFADEAEIMAARLAQRPRRRKEVAPQLLLPAPAAPKRIEVAQLDPHTLVGLAEANDGSGGWVVMEQLGDGVRDPYRVEPVGDERGQIVYANVQDAVEVLRTGKVWRHDMGEDDAAEIPW